MAVKGASWSLPSAGLGHTQLQGCRGLSLPSCRADLWENPSEVRLVMVRLRPRCSSHDSLHSLLPSRGRFGRPATARHTAEPSTISGYYCCYYSFFFTTP